jgi:hypothetical protein
MREKKMAQLIVFSCMKSAEWRGKEQVCKLHEEKRSYVCIFKRLSYARENILIYVPYIIPEDRAP